MQLTCPSCGTRYRLDAASLGPEGRVVRCSRCGHSWLARAPEERPEAAAAELAAPEAAAPTSSRRARRAGPGIAGWLALLVAVGGVLAGGALARDRIVAAWPPAARLYQLVGLALAPLPAELELRGVRTAHVIDNGVPVLVVEGAIVNVSNKVIELPPLRLALHDGERRELEHWLVSAPTARLGPGEAVEFSARREQSPAAARNVVVSLAVEE